MTIGHGIPPGPGTTAGRTGRSDATITGTAGATTGTAGATTGESAPTFTGRHARRRAGDGEPTTSTTKDQLVPVIEAAQSAGKRVVIDRIDEESFVYSLIEGAHSAEKAAEEFRLPPTAGL